jgi:hypothetical protein
MPDSKPNSQASKSNQNNFEYITPTPGGEIAPCPPSEVPLAGFLLIFQYIALPNIIFFNLQSMGDENVINAPVESLEEGKSSDTNTM